MGVSGLWERWVEEPPERAGRAPFAGGLGKVTRPFGDPASYLPSAGSATRRSPGPGARGSPEQARRRRLSHKVRGSVPCGHCVTFMTNGPYFGGNTGSSVMIGEEPAECQQRITGGDEARAQSQGQNGG